VIIATAGHVDHGKTTLLHALTGVDTDRLPEEKKRGMTIDLGYAYWPQADGRVIGFIDVPGHEKFLANMLAGIGGIDHALLVVACDDGVMAQTREHLMLLQLTSQPAITVVLTKADRVSEERLETVKQQVRALLADNHLPLFVTAAAQGLGIEALRQHLQQLPERAHPDSYRFRLAIDRAFSVKGAGLVVTGTALSGQVKTGDMLWLTGADAPMRVRGLHAQNQPTRQAHAGQRIALNISGDAQKADIARGDWLLSEKPRQITDRVIVALQTEVPLKQWQPLHIHHAARHITGRVSLLKDDLAELVLDTPLWLADNDKMVLRDISARHTLAGARCLLLNPPRRGKRQPAFLAKLEKLSRAVDDNEVLEINLSEGAVCLADFAWARQLTASGLTDLVNKPGYFQAGGRLLSAAVAQRWQALLHDTLARYHHQYDDQPGPGRERLRRMALPAENEELVLSLIEQMRACGAIVSRQGWLHLPEHQPGLSAAQQAVWEKISSLFADDPWWVRDMAKQTGEPEQTIRQLLQAAALQGWIIAIVKDRYFHRDRIQQFADLIREFETNQQPISAADFRDRLGVGRKLAVQILEYFDRVGFSRRRGNTHLLRDSSLF